MASKFNEKENERMTDLAHYESTLEKIITEYLVDHNWNEGNKSRYTRELGLDLEELKLFAKHQ